MNLNVYEKHPTFITDMKVYTQRHSCTLCLKIFYKPDSCLHHTQKCANSIRGCYPGGYVTQPLNIVDNADLLGINVDSSNHLFENTITFNVPVIEEYVDNDSIKSMRKHIPVCIAVASNIPGHERPTNIFKYAEKEMVRHP